MSLSQQDVVEYIKNLKLGEVKSLIDILEKELGVSASAPVGMMMSAGPAAAAAAPVEEKTEFDVEMKSFGENKIGVIKVIRAITGLGLKEAKDMVEAAPTKVKEGVSKEEAADIKKQLEEAGAQVVVS